MVHLKTNGGLVGWVDGWIDGWMGLGQMSGEFFCCCCCADENWQGPGVRTGLPLGSSDAVAAVAAASGLGLAPQDQLLLLLLSTSSSRHFKASRLLVCGARGPAPFRSRCRRWARSRESAIPRAPVEAELRSTGRLAGWLEGAVFAVAVAARARSVG